MNTLEKSGGRIPSDYVMDPYCPMFLEANLGPELYKKLEVARRTHLKKCIEAEIELLTSALDVLKKLEQKRKL